MTEQSSSGMERAVSVIMPVCNAGQYLQESLDAVRSQTLKDIEIICVDDGSTDSSGQILDDCARADSRITVIHTENRYAGAARNAGLKKACGKYVVFWDADDLFRKDALEILYKKSEKLQADICVCGARRLDNETGTVYASGAYLNRKMVPKEPVFSRRTIPQHIFNFTSNVPWNKMFRRAFLQRHGLHFQEIRQANDVYFSMTALCCARRICVAAQPLVTYRVENRRSLTGKASVYDMCAVDALDAVRRTMERNGLLIPENAMPAPEESKAEAARQLQRSFDNRAADALLFFLKKQWDINVYRFLYERYRESVIARFGLWEHPQEYYYNSELYEELQRIRELDADGFLLYEFRRYERKYQMRAGMTVSGYAAKAAGRLLGRK